MNRFIYISGDRGIPVPGDKGSSHHVTNVCRALSRAGLGGVLLTARPTAVRVGGVPIVPLARLDSFSCGADFVYERYSLWHVDGMDYARRNDLPFILEVNSPLPEEARRFRGLRDERLALQLSRRLMSGADAVICVSDQTAAWVTRQRGKSEGVWTVPNGVDEGTFCPNTQPLHLPFGVGSGPVIGFVGSFRPWHGVIGLLEAVDRCPSRPRIVCVGDGPGRKQFEQRARELGLTDRIHITGFVPHQEVPRWLAGCDLAVAPYEANLDFYFSPLKVFEFMALGLPLVAADVGQLSETVGAEERGLLYAAGNPASLAEAIERVISDVPASMARAARARQWVLENATWSQRVATILSRIDEARAVHG